MKIFIPLLAFAISLLPYHLNSTHADLLLSNPTVPSATPSPTSIAPSVSPIPDEDQEREARLQESAAQKEADACVQVTAEALKAGWKIISCDPLRVLPVTTPQP